MSSCGAPVEVVGEVPRTGVPLAELDGPQQAFADRYTGGTVLDDGRHAWLRLVPVKITSWDFRKLALADPLPIRQQRLS